MSAVLRTNLTLSILLAFVVWLKPLAGQSGDYVTHTRFVPHDSTVPANRGERVGLYLYEKVTQETADAITAGRGTNEVVLFIHGGSVPSVPDFDLQYQDYSWMEHLADAGFDTFAMDHTGYGFSPRPMMDDPCNMEPHDQAIVIPDVLSEPCEPDYRRELTTLRSERDEIDSVVSYIRTLRDVERVHLIGWSAGGRRAAIYAALYPEQVASLVLYAPSVSTTGPDANSGTPVPMALQTRETLMQDRWESFVACEDQVDPGIRDVVWQTIMGFDALGSVWRDEGVMRVRTTDSSGWLSEYGARITAPTLILVGEQDGLLPAGQNLYADMTANNKVLVTMACSTHFAVWEATQHKFLQEASLQWLREGRLKGSTSGQFTVEADGRFMPAQIQP